MEWLTVNNQKRLHSTLGYVSPLRFEQRWLADQQQQRMSAQYSVYGVRNSGAWLPLHDMHIGQTAAKEAFADGLEA